MNFDGLAGALENEARMIPEIVGEVRRTGISAAAVDLANLAPYRTGRLSSSTVVYSGSPVYADAFPGHSFPVPSAATFASAVAQIDHERPAGITNAARRPGQATSYAVFPLRRGNSPQARYDVVAAVVGRSNARLPRLWKEAVAKIRAQYGIVLLFGLLSLSALAAGAQPTVNASRSYWRAPVANVAALPAAGNAAGDVRRVLDTGRAYAWSGSAWSAVPASIAANSVALGTDTTGGYAGSSTEGGAATTALALSADPQNCQNDNEFAKGIAADGSAQCATPAGGGGGVGGSTGATDRAVLIASGAGGSTIQASAAKINADGSEFTLGGSIVGRLSLGSGAPWLRGVATTAWGGNATTYLQVGNNLEAILLTGFSAAPAYWHVSAHGMLVSPTQTNQPAMGTGLALLEVNSTTDGNAGRVVARVQGKAGQSADYLQVRSGSGADLVRVTSAGVLESTIAARLTPQSSPPFTCNSTTEGSIYYDSTDHGQCSCEGATPAWVSRSGGSCN